MEQNERETTAVETAASEETKKRRRRRKKKKKAGKRIAAVLLVLLIAVIIVVSVVVAPVISDFTRTKSGEETVVVVIPQGTSGVKIAEILKENGVIKSELAFRIKLKTSPYKDQLNYGEFKLKKEMCLEEIINTMRISTEKKKGIRITIPEGFSVEQIAARCEQNGLVTKEEFLKELSEGEFDYEFIKDIPEVEGSKYKLQGYLFPSTHVFAEDATAHDIIDTFLYEFEKEYTRVKDKLPEGMSMHEAIVRASLVEREAKLDNERPIISGVIQNRLDIDMILQIDAAVVYAISDGMYDVERVLYSDLKVESPYNLYKYPGLPVGPICNPGIKSIIAAMEPEEHKYLYYHTDEVKKDGSHIFSETYGAHKNS